MTTVRNVNEERYRNIFRNKKEMTSYRKEAGKRASRGDHSNNGDCEPASGGTSISPRRG